MSLLKAWRAVLMKETATVFVGGLFETIGSSQNLHSFGKYDPTGSSWGNVDNSAVLSTGTAEAIVLVDTDEDELRGVVVGGIFNYLNHSSNTVSYGNIAFFNQSSALWQPMGWGCDGPVSALAVVPITANGPGVGVPPRSCSEDRPCYSIAVAGRFQVCYQVRERVTLVFFAHYCRGMLRGRQSLIQAASASLTCSSHNGISQSISPSPKQQTEGGLPCLH